MNMNQVLFELYEDVTPAGGVSLNSFLLHHIFECQQVFSNKCIEFISEHPKH